MKEEELIALPFFRLNHGVVERAVTAFDPLLPVKLFQATSAFVAVGALRIHTMGDRFLMRRNCLKK